MKKRIAILAVACLALLVASAGQAASNRAAHPPRLKNEVAHAGIGSVSVTVDYKGGGPVTLTVGTTQDVLGSKVAQVWKNAPYAPGKWSLLAVGLDAGTQYWLRVDAVGSTWTSPAPVKTWTRSVVLDFQTIHVVNDGDAWPGGCGDFVFSLRVGDGWRNSYADWDSGLHWNMCVDSGQTITAPDEWGRWGLPDYRYDTIRDEFYAWDDDVSCIPGITKCYADCSSPVWLDPTCGDLGYGFDEVDVHPAGTRAITLHALGTNINGNAVDVVLTGSVTVHYWP